ncbi:hypothetical protein [Brevibacillus sp. SYSU BS000544]|uniref:hypothetical protein n=1 Tax=Brevibacillus sp. SYSU BS000544 TaxID=3416443 RepID=UPI003CE56D95
MEQKKELAYKLFNIPNDQIRDEVSHMRESVSGGAIDLEFKQEVLRKLAELDAKIDRILYVIQKQ